MSGILYGFIHCFKATQDAEAHNQAVLQSLPLTGALIIRPLFSVLPNSRGHCYYGHLMHFSSFMKDSYGFDECWLEQYEALLERLFWDSSEVLHTYCGERRTWGSKGTTELSRPTAMNICTRSLYPSYHDLQLIVDVDAAIIPRKT
ncbi:hypothetical protein [Pseudomonas sp. Fl4BN1]|uniref:hypothetical protein n=1 Tax=Pseudomonas sp. Fl4BN1 TaxID=2697651 RepID=UPI001378B0C6|nr:hypothetical protein [Pseudomonas sp. Fl4BN1]NBF10807.1 hypothetical protein [Pseudomonas sp. Fl4BN1]